MTVAFDSVGRAASFERARAGSTDGGPTVLVCDWHDERARGLRALLRAMEGAPVLSALGTKAVEVASVAVVAVDRANGDQPSPAQIDASLSGMDRLRRRAVPCVCYGRGTDRWPLATRCRVFLTGAVSLLDPDAPNFETRLESEVRAHVACIQAGDGPGSARRLAAEELGIVGTSPALHRALRAVERSAQLPDMPVLLLGESGTGKELLARAVHELDPRRRTEPFVALNCAAVTKSLAEAELFGHRKGVFSGADRDRLGLVRAAHGGVLFLDEIGELDLDLQAKLLRVIQERRVRVVGDTHETPVDLRIVAATHRDLRDMVRQGRFRWDLYNRLHVCAIELAPLRERREDIPPLVHHLVRKHAGASGAPGVDPEFVEALQLAQLEGNVRQLENIVQRAVALADPDRPLGLSELPPELWRELSMTGSESSPASTGLGDAPGSGELNLSRALASRERSLIEAALRATGGHQGQAARLMGITPRSLYNKLRKHHFSRKNEERG